MKEETHTLKCQYKGVQPYIKVTAYELSSVDCSSDKTSGYYGETATLTANAAPAGYNFSGWNITGSQMTGNSFRFQGDVTAKANYSAIQYNVTLQNDGHGTIAASKTTGNIGDTITLSNTPATHYHFDHYATTGATLTGSQFKFNTSNVTAKGFFAADPSYSVTLQTDGHGTIGANKTTGYTNDIVTLNQTPAMGYRFNNYTITGATLTGSQFKFGTSNVTAKANYAVNTTGKFILSGIVDNRSNPYHSTLALNNIYYSGNMPSSYLLSYTNTYVGNNVYQSAYYFKNNVKLRNVSGYSRFNVTEKPARYINFRIGLNEGPYTGVSNTGNYSLQSANVTITGHVITDAWNNVTGFSPVLEFLKAGTVVSGRLSGYMVVSGELYT